MSLDLETIGIGFDTSGLDKGTAALKVNAQAALKAADAADKATTGITGMSGGSDKARSAAEKLTLGINNQIQKLQDQVNMFGMSERRAELYKFAIDGATNSQLAQVEALQKQTANLERAGAAGRAAGDAIKAGLVLAAVAVTAAAVAFEKLIGNVARYKDLAEQTGGDPAGLAALRTAADVGGTSVEALAMAAIRLEKNLSRVDDESKGAGKALAAIGITLDDFKKLTADQKLREIGKALNNYADGGGKVAVIQDIMGRGSAQFLSALKELGNETEKHNGLTNAQIELADDYKDKQAKVRSELSQMVEIMAVGALPAVTGLITAFKETIVQLTGMSEGASDFDKNKAIEAWARGTAESVALVGDALLALVRIGKVVTTSLQSVFADVNMGITIAANSGPMGSKLLFKEHRDAIAEALARRNAIVANSDAALNALMNSSASTFRDALKKSYAQQDADRKEATIRAFRASERGITGNKEALDYLGKTDPKEKKAAKVKVDPQVKADYDQAIQMQKLHADESKFLNSELVKDLESLRKRDTVNEYDYHAKKNGIALAGIAEQRAIVEQEIIIANASTMPLLAKQKAVESFQKALQDLNQAKRALDADYLRQEQESNAKVNTAMDKRLDDMEQSTKKLTEEQDALRREREEFGLTEKQLIDLTLARAEELAVMKEKEAFTRQSIDLSGAQSAELQKQADLIRANAKYRAENTGIKEMAGQWKSLFADVERGLTDSLFRAFESGKGFFKTLWDGIKNIFKTTALKLIINAVVGGVGGGGSMLANAGGMLGGLGGGGAGGAGGIGPMGMLSNLQSVYSGASNMMSIGSQVVGGSMSIANALGTVAANATGTGLTGLLATNAAFGTSAASAVAGNLAMAAGTAPALAAGTVAAAGGTAAAGAGITAALGAIGPVGWAVIAGVAVAAIFGGGGDKETTGGGMRGTLGPSGASGQNYSNWKQDGGWFGSDSSGTDFSAMDTGALNKFTAASNALRQSTIASAEALGLSSDAAKEFSQSFDLATGSGEAAITALFKSFGDNLALSVAPELANILKTGETASTALTRVATSLAVVNVTFAMLGKTLLSLSIASGDSASKLADAFGGLDKLAAASKSFYDTYYTEAEKATTSQQKLTQALGQFGIALPASKAAFREVALALDLTTDAGRAAYAAMLTLAPEFASSTEAMLQVAKDSIADLFGSIVDVFKNALATIASERDATQGAMRQMNNPSVMTPEQIRRVIASTAITAPGASGISQASLGLTAADKNYATAKASRDVNNAVANGSLGAALESANTANAFVKTMQAAQASQTITLERVASLAEFLSSIRYGEDGPTVMGAPMIGGSFSAYADYANSINSSQDATTNADAQARTNSATAQATFANASANYQRALAAGIKATGDAAVAAALATTKAAELKLKTEVSKYTGSMQNFAIDAGKSAVKLGKLREETLKYYDTQKQLAELMTTSAVNLRGAVSSARSGQLTAAQSLAQQQRGFAGSYSMALSTTGATQAGYADKMATALPGLTDALMDTSSTRAEWAIATGRLFAQSQAIADSLEANAPQNYAADSLALLGEIDAALVVLETSAKSAEAIISEAVRAGSDTTSNGLRTVANAIVTASGIATATVLGNPAALMAGYTAAEWGVINEASRQHRYRGGGDSGNGDNYPGFAAGGMFGGGLRLVGENGPEVEATGPSRIYNASQMRSVMGSGGGNTNRLEALMESVLQSIEGLRAEAQATAGHTSKTARLLDRAMPDGDALATRVTA